VTDQLRFYEAFKTTKGKDMDKQLYEQGKRDCEQGIPHESGRGVSYDLGYSEQYAWEQQQ